MLTKQAFLIPMITEKDLGVRSASKSSTFNIVERPTDSSPNRSSFRGLPWLGLSAVAVSVLTVIASYLVLHLSDGRQIEEKTFTKPAPWLSAITSVNSICLYIALLEGFSIAQRRDLTDIWLHRTSRSSLRPAGHRPYRIGLAIIIVIVAALNSFLLQNATGEHIPFRTEDTNIQILSLVSLPEGWSGTLNANGQTQLDGGIATDLNQILNDKLDVFKTSDAQGCRPNATCHGQMPTVGFKVSCRSSLQPYDLPPDRISDLATVTAPIFSSSLNWNATKPNNMYLRMLWKGSNGSKTSCAGNYEVRDCDFEIGIIAQNVVIKSTKYGADVPSEGRRKGDTAYTYQLDEDSQYSYKTDVVLSPLPVVDGVGSKTMIGGLAQFFARYYNSAIDISYSNGAAGIVTEGFYSSMIGATTPADGQKCNTTIGSSSAVDLADEVVNEIRRMTFGVVAASLAREHTGVAIQFPATRVDTSVVYAVNWIYWIAGLILTLVIVLAVLPAIWAIQTFRQRASTDYLDGMKTSRSSMGQTQGGRYAYYHKRWTR